MTEGLGQLSSDKVNALYTQINFSHTTNHQGPSGLIGKAGVVFLLIASSADKFLYIAIILDSGGHYFAAQSDKCGMTLIELEGLDQHSSFAHPYERLSEHQLVLLHPMLIVSFSAVFPDFCIALKACLSLLSVALVASVSACLSAASFICCAVSLWLVGRTNPSAAWIKRSRAS